MHFIPALGVASILGGLGLIIKSEGLEAGPGLLLGLFGAFLTTAGILVVAGVF